MVGVDLVFGRRIRSDMGVIVVMLRQWLYPNLMIRSQRLQYLLWLVCVYAHPNGNLFPLPGGSCLVLIQSLYSFTSVPSCWLGQTLVSIRAIPARACKPRPPKLICRFNCKKIEIQNQHSTPAKIYIQASTLRWTPYVRHQARTLLLRSRHATQLVRLVGARLVEQRKASAAWARGRGAVAAASAWTLRRMRSWSSFSPARLPASSAGNWATTGDDEGA
jgi:hypothetical protein